MPVWDTVCAQLQSLHFWHDERANKQTKMGSPSAFSVAREWVRNVVWKNWNPLCFETGFQFGGQYRIRICDLYNVNVAL